MRPAWEMASLPQQPARLSGAPLHAAPSAQKEQARGAVPAVPCHCSPHRASLWQRLGSPGGLYQRPAEPKFHSCRHVVLVIFFCSPLQKRVKYLFISLWGKAEAISTFIDASAPSWNITGSQQVPCSEDAEQEGLGSTGEYQTHARRRDYTSRGRQTALRAGEAEDRWRWPPGWGRSVRGQPRRTREKGRQAGHMLGMTALLTEWLQRMLSQPAGKGRWHERDFFICFNERWVC